MPDETCRAFDSVTPGAADALHRFVVGADAAPQRMSASQVKALGDPFATLLLARGKFPRTAEELVDGIRAAVRRGHALKRLSTFVVGEGSQLPAAGAAASVERNLRFIATLGRGPDGPDVFISVGDPKQVGGVEVMAWKRGAGGFNYYRSTGRMWMFAGNSRDALAPRSRGKGPFESHPSGALLMKELKEPWNNWHSPLANIPVTAFPQGDRRRRHPWFVKREPGGAYSLEFEAARPAITRWAQKRFKRLRDQGGTVGRPRQIMRQVLDTPTVNLVTSFRESRGLRDGDQVDLPASFFVDVDGLFGILELDFPPPFVVRGRIYKRALEKFDVRLEDDQGFVQKGDTHFCFLAPERAFEDQEVLRELIRIGLVSKRLAACLLMVDPWNPVFSERRRALLQYVPDSARVTNRRSRFSAELGTTIVAAAKSSPAGSPEREFAERWAIGTGFKRPFNRILARYYDAVRDQLKRQAGFDAYFQLAEERRRRFKDSMPIAQEFPLLLPRTNITSRGRRMRADGTVGTG